MAHGYIDDGYGIDGGIGSDRDDDREHRWRDRDHREHGWRGRDEWRDRDDDRGMMFGDRSHDRERSRLWSDENRSSDRGWGREHGFAGSRESREDRGSFSPHRDDHYRSWRDRHMSELDRDYADYCREREQQFHSDFDSWRQQRHANYQPLRTGMTNSGMSHDPEGAVQVATEGEADETNGDAMGAATLGTNSSASTGRRR